MASQKWVRLVSYGPTSGGHLLPIMNISTYSKLSEKIYGIFNVSRAAFPTFDLHLVDDSAADAGSTIDPIDAHIWDQCLIFADSITGVCRVEVRFKPASSTEHPRSPIGIEQAEAATTLMALSRQDARQGLARRQEEAAPSAASALVALSARQAEQRGPAARRSQEDEMELDVPAPLDGVDDGYGGKQEQRQAIEQQEEEQGGPQNQAQKHDQINKQQQQSRASSANTTATATATAAAARKHARTASTSSASSPIRNRPAKKRARRSPAGRSSTSSAAAAARARPPPPPSSPPPLPSMGGDVGGSTSTTTSADSSLLSEAGEAMMSELEAAYLEQVALVEEEADAEDGDYEPDGDEEEDKDGEDEDETETEGGCGDGDEDDDEDDDGGDGGGAVGGGKGRESNGRDGNGVIGDDGKGQKGRRDDWNGKQSRVGDGGKGKQGRQGPVGFDVEDDEELGADVKRVTLRFGFENRMKFSHGVSVPELVCRGEAATTPLAVYENKVKSHASEAFLTDSRLSLRQRGGLGEDLFVEIIVEGTGGQDALGERKMVGEYAGAELENGERVVRATVVMLRKKDVGIAEWMRESP